MSNKKLDELEKLNQKIAELEARRNAELAKIKERERKRKLSILWSYGEMIEKALIDGTLAPEKLKADCIKYLPEGAKRTNAINEIDAILRNKKTDKKPVKTATDKPEGKQADKA